MLPSHFSIYLSNKICHKNSLQLPCQFIGVSPKSVSEKVLVAAYWLFVVLMVSTFTSNLAAFLTVERMQATGEGGVKNLDMLADQSRIGYTLLKHSSVHQYFKNMAGAEDELYGY